jgi:phenylalanyl-tRNA synthetase beta chain
LRFTKKELKAMTVSYNWLCDYLPIKPAPDQLSKILTSIGLEVESLEKQESVKGSLQGLVVGEVIASEKHPNADKLKLTKLDVGRNEPLQIVCGAANVAVGQKVIVAIPGTTIFPLNGEPLSLKTAKIRGIESQGMICAEDEIGLGDSHDGILILPSHAVIGAPVSNYFQLSEDYIFEIGLTPNHMDAMCHLGIARDVCAYLSHHDKNGRDYKVTQPNLEGFKTDNNALPISVTIENKTDCQRYSGVTITGISIKDSPAWLLDKLKAIGVRPVNNVVDATNFVLHELGQPLHAFDAEKIKGKKIIVKNLPEGTKFITLDEKPRKLFKEDLMICDEQEPICMAGVFGGLNSGIKESTKNIFLESAWFNPTVIRKTSFRHALRTDAAGHFEKGVDISGTVYALKRASLLIKELAGGEIASDLVDVYPQPKEKTSIPLTYHYLETLSGKKYAPAIVKKILLSLGFELVRDERDEIQVRAPYSKPDIELPADLVEEIMRVDGYDAVPIPSSITISPSVETEWDQALFKEKIAGYLTGQGFNEIFTNSITNSAYFTDQELETSVKMINNLSAELNIMRPSLLETGLESIAYNINRKNSDLRFFEFGKTYGARGVGKYSETNHLCLYITGNLTGQSWKSTGIPSDFYYLKGICTNIFQLMGISPGAFGALENKKLGNGLKATFRDQLVLEAGMVLEPVLQRFDIRQPVFFADFNWDLLLEELSGNMIEFRELPRQLPVTRDLAMVVEKSLRYEEVENILQQIGLDKLQKVQLFDIFESEKLGSGKKSLAVSFSFLNEEKTLTDKEIDGMMLTIMTALERELHAEIRK